MSSSGAQGPRTASDVQDGQTVVWFGLFCWFFFHNNS